MDINQKENGSAFNLTNNNFSSSGERGFNQQNKNVEYKDWSNLKVKMLKVRRLTKGKNF